MSLLLLNQIALEHFPQIKAMIVGVIEAAHISLGLILGMKDVFQRACQAVPKGSAHTFCQNTCRDKLRVGSVFDGLLSKLFDRIQQAVVIIIIGGRFSGQ